jgi:hypothetical protein
LNKSVLGIAVSLATLMCGTEAFAQDGALAAKVRRWMAEMKGDISVDGSGLDGTSIDVDSTLGLDGQEGFDEVQVTMGLPIIGKFNFQYLRGGYEGSSVLSSDITFGGTTFAASSQVDTKIDFETYTLLWSFGATTPGAIGADVGAGAIAGIKYLDIQADMHDQSGLSEDADINAPIPVIGAYVRANLLKFLSVEAQVHGIKYFDTFNTGLTGTFYDATIAADLKMAGLFAGVGYRLYHFDVEYENGDDEADVKIDLSGFFFEAGFSF